MDLKRSSWAKGKKAKAAKRVTGRNTSLRVSVKFAPKGTKPRVTVTGPRGFKRVISKSTTFRKARPGRYTVVAAPLAGAQVATFPTYSTTKARLRKGVAGWVGVRYMQRVASTTRIVQPSALETVTGDPNGVQRVVIEDPKALVVPGSVIAAGVGDQTPGGLLVEATSVTRAGTQTIAQTIPAPLTAIGPQAEIIATPELKMSSDDFSRMVSGTTKPAGSRRSLLAKKDKGFEKPYSCSTEADATVEGDVSFDAGTDVGVSWGGWLKPLTIRAHAGVRIKQEAKLEVTITGAAKCELELELLPEDYRFTPWAFSVGPVPVVIVPKLNFILSGEASVGAALTSTVEQSLETSFGIRYNGRVTPYGDAEAKFSTTQPSPSGTLDVKAAVGPKLAFDFYDVAGPYLTAGVFMQLQADTAKTPWWRLSAGLEAGGGFRFKVWKFNFDRGVPDILSKDWTIAQAAAGAPLALDGAALPAGDVDVPYSGQVKVTKGKAKSFAVTAGRLPAGLALSATTGKITGTPTGYSPSPFTVRVLDADGNAARRDYTINVRTKPIALTTASLPGAVAGTDYRTKLTVTGSAAPYTWALSGALPAGLSFSATDGQFAGVPTRTGTFPLTVTVKGADGKSANRAFTLTVAAPELKIATAALPDGMEGVVYSAQLDATGGEGEYTWSATALPAGLKLDTATGAITGRPSVNGDSTVTVTVKDTTGHQATREVALKLHLPGMAIATPTFPVELEDEPFSGQLSVLGGTAPYTWSAEGLPAGLTLNASTGAITGAPTNGGTTTFTATVTDASGAQANKSLQIEVIGEPAGTPNSLSAIDCWSTTGCLAVAYNRTYLYDGTEWTLVSSTGNFGPDDISCYSATRCGGVSSADAILWDGASWTSIGRPAPPTTGTDSFVKAISCYSATRCEAAFDEKLNVNDSTGHSVRIDGTSFGRTVPMPNEKQWDIDCLSDSFCAAVQPATGFSTFNGSSWSGASMPTQNAYMTRLSCASTTSCLISTGYDDKIVRWNGSALTDSSGAGNGGLGYAIDCVVGDTFCAVAWRNGSLNTFEGGTPGTRQDFTGVTPNAVTCPSPTMCIAVGSNARWYVWNGTSWKRHRGFAYN